MQKTLISLAVITACSPVYADHFSMEHSAENPERIVVTANRFAQSDAEILASVDVITREEIEALQPASVADLLTQTAGLTFAQQGGAAQKTSVFMRGTNSNHVLVLIDGVRVGSATTGSTELSSISPALIERVEVLKGPRAALYGSDAIGGVIQIFTRELEHGKATVNVKAGSHQHKGLDAAVGLEFAGIQNTISVSRELSEGFSAKESEPDDDGYDRSALNLKGGVELTEALSLDWIGQVEEGGFEFDNKYGNDQTSYKNTLLSLGSTLELEKTQVRLQLGQSKDTSLSYGKKVSEKDADLFETRSKEAKLQIHQQLAKQTYLQLGHDYQQQKVVSKTAYNETERDIHGTYLQLSSQYEDLLLDGAVRYDDIETVGHKASYNLSLGYQLTQQWLASLNYGTGFKAPTFNDLYYPGSGNPDLTPQESKTTELLIKGHADNYRVELAIYDSEIENFIEWRPQQNGPWKPLNIHADIRGLDFTLATKLFNVDWQVTATLLDTKDNTGKDLIRRPEQNYGLSGSYQVGNWELSGDVNYHSNTFDSADVRLGSYALANAFVGYRFNDNFKLRAFSRNLFDKDYTVVNGYNTAERQFGLEIQFEN